MTKTRRVRRNITDEFKQQMVQLYNSGKPGSEIVKEYDLTSSALGKWIAYYNETGSFKEQDNRTDEENRLIEFEKEVRQLRIENDIFKQAALIMGRK